MLTVRGGPCADALIDNLTVFEMLVYTAELKLPMRIPFKDKVRKVQSVVDQLALNTCRNVRIGNPLTRGISGAPALRPPCSSRGAAGVLRRPALKRGCRHCPAHAGCFGGLAHVPCGG